MSVEDLLDPSLLSDAEEFARERSMSLEQLVVTAVDHFVHPRPTRAAAADHMDLPVATRLQLRSPDFTSMSMGKWLELVEDDLPIQKLR